MPVYGGFFNSVSGDRKYDAEDMNTLFEGMVADGVFSAIGDVFVVSATTGMQVSIGSGKAFFLNSWVKNTADAFKTLSDSHSTYDRIDIVALDFDKSSGVRANTIVVVEGTPSGTPVPPTLSDTTTHLQVPLAHIYVDAAASFISQGKITNKVGTVDCPFITGLLDQVDIATLLTQWEADYNVWKAGIEADLDAIDTGDVFTELDAMRAQQTGVNLLINGDFQVNTGSTSEPTYEINDGKYPGIAELWGYLGVAGLSAQFALSRTTRTDGRKAYRIACATTKPSLAAGDHLRFVQEIEANYLGRLAKGFPNAKAMTLGFDFKSNLTGTFVVELYDNHNTFSISHAFNVAVADTWESFEWNIPKETGMKLTMNNTSGITVNFWLLAGTTYTGGGSLQTSWGVVQTNKRAYGQVNLASSTSNYIELSDVQLELGSVKSDYERVAHDVSLLRCQRYIERHSMFEFFVVATSTTTVVTIMVPLACRKRINNWSLTSSSIYLTDYPDSSTDKYLISGVVGGDYAHLKGAWTVSADTVTVGAVYPAVINDMTLNAQL